MLWGCVLASLIWLCGHVTRGDEEYDILAYGCDRIAIPDYPGHYVQMVGDGTEWMVEACPDSTVFAETECTCLHVTTVYWTPPTTGPPTTTKTPPTTTMSTTTVPTTITTETTTTTKATTLPTTTTATTPTTTSDPTTTTTFRPTTPKFLFKFSTIKNLPSTRPKNVPTLYNPRYKFVLFESQVEATTTKSPLTRHDIMSTKRETTCEGCKFQGGVGFNHHPTDCYKYVMCYVDGIHGNLTGHVRQCGIGKYWDQDLLTCRYSTEVACDHEKCIQNSLVESYPFEGDCRGYWRCEHGVSIGYCCPKGQGYHDGEGCVPDPSCNTPCDNIDGPQECDKIGVAGEPAMFQQHMVGHGYVDMWCAGGTVFNETICGCQTDTRPDILPRECRKEMELDFTTNFHDSSGNDVYIQNINVTIDKGSACFDGNSTLVIPRFANVEIGKTLEIRIRYKLRETYNKPEGGLQALVFNSDCGKDSTLVVAAGLRSSYFELKSENDRRKSITVKHAYRPDGWNDAVFSLHGNVMKSDVNNNVKTRRLLGNVGRSRCGLKIGWGEGFNSFLGCIDKISISFCPP